MTVSVEYAEEHLKELLEAADAGAAVSIERAGKPPVELRLGVEITPQITGGKRILGAGTSGLGSVSWEEWQRIDREWKKSFLDESDVD